MDARKLLPLAPAFLRPVLSQLLDRLDALEAQVAQLNGARPSSTTKDTTQ